MDASPEPVQFKVRDLPGIRCRPGDPSLRL